MNQLFISYSRKDIEFARRITERFETEGLETWVDWQDIPPSVDWMKEIQKGIEEADIFLYLVSPDSISSEVCAKEVEYAVANGKRILPVIVREFDTKTAPTTISHLNWIFFCRPQDRFDDAFAKVMESIHTDYDWVKVQRRLQVKALEWERNGSEDSFLLRGRDLQDAEAQLLVNGEKSPRPTDLQRAYVGKSRDVENAQLELQREKEKQLELEKSLGTRLRRSTYILLIIFTVAFAALYAWLYKLVTDLSLQSVTNQMASIVETGSAGIDGNQFQKLIDTYPTANTSVYSDPYWTLLESYLAAIKEFNTKVDPNMSLYAITGGAQKGEIMIIVDTNQESSYKDTYTLNDLTRPTILGMEETTSDTQIYQDESGSNITSCAPIIDHASHSVGALCTDFHVDIVYEVRAGVMKTLGIAFIFIYPAMIVLVLFATRATSRLLGRFKRKNQLNEDEFLSKP